MFISPSGVFTTVGKDNVLLIFAYILLLSTWWEPNKYWLNLITYSKSLEGLKVKCNPFLQLVINIVRAYIGAYIYISFI